MYPKEKCRKYGGRWSTAKEMSHYLLSPIVLPPIFLLSSSYLPPISLLSPLCAPLCAPHTWSIKRLSKRKVGERGRERIYRTIEVESKTKHSKDEMSEGKERGEGGGRVGRSGEREEEGGRGRGEGGAS